MSLLSNFLLDDPDQELERRGHAFWCYADDSNIYGLSYAVGERVLASITQFCRSESEPGEECDG